MEKGQIIGTAYAQSCIAGFEAAKAIDRNPETCWMAEPYYQWWLLDCEGLCDIETITIETKQDNNKFYRYAIDYSEDRTNWYELYEKTDDALPKSGGETYPANIVARYIRITMTYCSVDEAVSLVNVEVTGERIESVKYREHALTQKRIRAIESDEVCGFSESDTEELEPGWTDRMLLCDKGNSYFGFHDVELGKLEGQQLKGFFLLPEKDRTLHIHAEIRLDTVDGRIIGSMDMHRQYTPWLQFACDLEDGVYGKRNLYFCITRLDALQKLGILWLRIMPKPVLTHNIVDHADEAPSSDGEYRAYLGNMHCHTGFTDGSNTPSYAYDYARYVANMDFLGITEHSNLFDDTFDASVSRKWRDLKRFAEEKTENGMFLAIMGSETTWYNQFGHMNIYGADFFLNPYELRYNDTNLYYARLKEFPRVINQWNHPWSCGNRHLDMFEPYDPELDKVMYTIEINSIEWTVMDGLSYYIHALDMGWHVSPVGSQDNHKPNWGTENDIRTGIVAKQLTKADFYDAIRNHRTYYSCARNLRVIYCVNGAMMGSVIPSADQYTFTVMLSNEPDDAELEKIDVLGEHGEVLLTVPVTGHSAEVSFRAETQSKYYFLKIWQKDGAFAATTPVWVE